MADEQDGAPRTTLRREPWPGCLVCAHLRDDFRCPAFPDRVPLPIASGEFSHLEPVAGQAGSTVFTLVDEPSEAQRLRARVAAERGATWAIAALERWGEPAVRR